jgi:hypothetical protein
MIDLMTDQLIVLSDVPSILPLKRGVPVNQTTVYRWARVGHQGVLLETIRVGGTTYTSAEALQRFAEAQSRPSTPKPAPQAPRAAQGRSEARRLRDSRAAADELERMGA